MRLGTGSSELQTRIRRHTTFGNWKQGTADVKLGSRNAWEQDAGNDEFETAKSSRKQIVFTYIHIYIYIYTHVYFYIHIYTYIYIKMYMEREREKERAREIDTVCIPLSLSLSLPLIISFSLVTHTFNDRLRIACLYTVPMDAV